MWGSFINTGKINKLHFFQSPNLICGENTIHWTDHIKEAHLSLKDTEITPLDKDILIEGNFEYKNNKS